MGTSSFHLKLLPSTTSDQVCSSCSLNPSLSISSKLITTVTMVKAVVAGASGGIGQPLSLLLKASPLIDELALYDVVNTPGVAADLSHISSPSAVKGYLPAEGGAEAAFKDADIIVIPAGIPPKAFILIISNPVNSTVPISAEVLKAKNVFDPQRLFGVTTLDIVRAETFVASITGEKQPQNLTIPVVGGHSGATIIPLFSKASPSVSIPDDKYDALVNRVQFGGDE